MRAAVQYPAVARPVSQDGVHDFINTEQQKLNTQMRTVLNFRGGEKDTVNTAGAGAWTTIWASPAPPSNAVWRLVAEVAGISLSGQTAQQMAACVTGVFTSLSGVVAQLGTTTVVDRQRSDAAVDVQFTVSGTTVLVQVKDNAASAMRFTAIVETHEGLPA